MRFAARLALCAEEHGTAGLHEREHREHADDPRDQRRHGEAGAQRGSGNVGPQAAAAMVLFGAPVDGPRAAEIGLAWACHPDDELIERAIAFAARAATVPRALSAAATPTVRRRSIRSPNISIG